MKSSLLTTKADGAAELDATASRAARLPNLIVIGAMKASTTTFYELITRHPGVWFPDVKEPHYFTSERYGDRDAWREYLGLFAQAPESAQVIGEASTGYSKIPRLGPTPQRIRETLGLPKLVYLIRDPVERVVSNYRHAYGHLSSAPTLERVVEDDPIVVTASRYAEQIDAYTNEFGIDGLLVVTTDELHRDTVATIRRVESFLGLDPFGGWPAEPPAANSRKSVAQGRLLNRCLPPGVKSLLKRTLPTALSGGLRSLAPVRSRPLPVTQAEIDLLQEQVADDLARLVEMLGNRVATWPSVERLRRSRGIATLG